jgi:hypothetical protein
MPPSLGLLCTTPGPGALFWLMGQRWAAAVGGGAWAARGLRRDFGGDSAH